MQSTDRYDFKAIEAKWQQRWRQEQPNKVRNEEEGEKYYILEMFPYPSGKIHMGHVRNYSIGDVIARYKRMRGYKVLHPMGWDAFGMPAENAAMKQNIHPAVWTEDNIAYMRKQLQSLGLSYDWDRELTTCTPEYYRWEQQFFLQMLEKGIAYRRNTTVNWCEDCQTVLAREQVLDGHCWRCEQPVSPKLMDGWFLRITDYAEELLAELDSLKGWPERVLGMQRNWIGKSTGLACDFALEGGSDTITIFTTRPDTIYGVTFMSLAVEHPLLKTLAAGLPENEALQAFIRETIIEKQRSSLQQETEKKGVFTGRFCINPFNGERVPIYAANFVLMEYGTGAVMGVPAHDQRDFEFARVHGLPLRVVVQPKGKILDPALIEEAWPEEGVLVNSGAFSGMDSVEAQERIITYAQEQGFGKPHITYRLRDWGVSRQRYWGAPIPVIHCPQCGIVPAPEDQLPVMLPGVGDMQGNHAPLHQQPQFYEVSCPRCDTAARRETDTFDTFMESSWYFIRYTSPQDTKQAIDPRAAAYWLPVDQYVGGVEHAILHLLYARFFTKVLRDLGYINISEPFINLLTQGMVTKEGFKMSKSKGNVVDPDALIKQYGADTVRLFALFASPPERDLEWNAQGVEGAFRFLNRLYILVSEHCQHWVGNQHINHDALNDISRQLHRKMHQTIRRVTESIENNFHFNTAIAGVMELINLVTASREKDDLDPVVLHQALETALMLLYPMAPHCCEELWRLTNHQQTLDKMRWPVYNPEAAQEERLTVVVQVNGKMRAKLELPADVDDDAIKALALTDEKIVSLLANKAPQKVILVGKKLVNIVC